MSADDPPNLPWASDSEKVSLYVQHWVARQRDKSGTLTADDLAFLRGTITALVVFRHISHSAARELITPILGEDVAEEWFRVTTIRITGEPEGEGGADGAADDDVER